MGKRSNRRVGSTASVWVPESIEHLAYKQRPLGSMLRLPVDPQSYFRAQLLAILNAIKEAQARNIPEIRVITNSLPFVDNFSRKWKDTKGNSVENKDLYREIKALTEKIKVHFQGMKYSEDDKLLVKVDMMCKAASDSPMRRRK